ncbi:MAG: AhpC/TSA family protein [Bacteroides sp.]|nr:AhpC/TSA family protein [Bacteroides sp.]
MFKHLVSLSMSGLMALTLTVSSKAASEFSLKGSLAGMPDSVRVVLVDVEDPNGKREIIAEAMPKGGDFELKGNLKSPRMCELAFQRYSPQREGYLTSISTRVMPEPGEMTFSTELTFDSLRKSRGTEGLVKITGSKAHDEFCEYFAQVYPAEKKESDASYLSAKKYFATNDNKDTMAVYNARKNEAIAELVAAKREFMAAHPSYNISGYLAQKELEKLFAYTADEIDAMVDMVKVCPDTARVATVNRRKNHAMRYALNRQCPDFEVTHADGNVAQFSSLINPGKYTFIDFWASWCGPCRAAIPHVRELYKKYDGKLDVYSISVDETEKPWRNAMKKEQMEWAQLRLDGEKQMGEGAKAFFLTTIPRLIILNDKGEVICSTNLPDEATACLEKHLGK